MTQMYHLTVQEVSQELKVSLTGWKGRHQRIGCFWRRQRRICFLALCRLQRTPALRGPSSRSAAPSDLWSLLASSPLLLCPSHLLTNGPCEAIAPTWRRRVISPSLHLQSTFGNDKVTWSQVPGIRMWTSLEGRHSAYPVRPWGECGDMGHVYSGSVRWYHCPGGQLGIFSTVGERLSTWQQDFLAAVSEELVHTQHKKKGAAEDKDKNINCSRDRTKVRN